MKNSFAVCTCVLQQEVNTRKHSRILRKEIECSAIYDALPLNGLVSAPVAVSSVIGPHHEDNW